MRAHFLTQKITKMIKKIKWFSDFKNVVKRHWYRVSHRKHLYFPWDTLYVRNVQLYYIYSREKVSYPSLPRALENRTDGVGGDVMRSLTALTPLNFWDLHNKNLKQFTLKANFYHYSPPPNSDVTLTPHDGKCHWILNQLSATKDAKKS